MCAVCDTPVIRFSLGMESGQADAGRDGRTRIRETKFSDAE